MTLEQMPPPPGDAPPPTASPGTTVAVDGTGLTPGAISTFLSTEYVIAEKDSLGANLVKWVVVADLPRQLILAPDALARSLQ
jgi:hypothetical protein